MTVQSKFERECELGLVRRTASVLFPHWSKYHTRTGQSLHSFCFKTVCKGEGGGRGEGAHCTAVQLIFQRLCVYFSKACNLLETCKISKDFRCTILEYRTVLPSLRNGILSRTVFIPRYSPYGSSRALSSPTIHTTLWLCHKNRAFCTPLLPARNDSYCFLLVLPISRVQTGESPALRLTKHCLILRCNTVR